MIIAWFALAIMLPIVGFAGSISLTRGRTRVEEGEGECGSLDSAEILLPVIGLI